MKCNEVWTAPFLLQQILSLGDPILHNQAELIATTGRGGEGGAEKRKGENEARKGERKEGRKEKESCGGSPKNYCPLPASITCVSAIWNGQRTQ